MAKRKKNRKAVLVTSCVMAALIVASSSFAWFTSKDEVTNRLSANADYDVSIVESFAPPENWLPGQEVNKDVYAVNTGSIGAFVKEEVSGVMTYTVEKKTNALDDNKSVKLTAAEKYVVESGSYLALAPAVSTHSAGEKVVDMTTNATNLNGYTAGATDFTPDVEGLYVFRRSIGVDPTSQTEKFKYDGYYYKGGNFYKVKIMSVTPDNVVDLAGDGEKADGNLSAATVKYYEEETVTAVPNLTYDATNNRLVASVSTGSTGATYDQLQTAAEAYDKALEDYQLALAAYQAATSENNTANGNVASAKTAMDNAYNELQDAIADVQAKTDAKAVADALVADLTAQRSALATQIGDASSGLTKEKADKLAAKNTADANVTAAQANSATPYQDIEQQLDADVYAQIGVHVVNATYAQLNGLFETNYENYQYYQLIVAQKKAQEEYDAADAALTAATTQKASVDTALGTATTNASNAASALTTAQNTKDAKQTAYNNKVTDYNNAVNAAGAGGTSGSLDTARTTLSNAAQTLANAEATYNELSDDLNSATDIKININLSNAVTTAGGVADKWQLKPADPSTTDIAEFYYTGILEGAETSSQLVDSVELDSSVTKEMYKNFDFDLNVVLKSAQIAYDADNETILATAATNEIGATPTMTNNKDINTALTW